MNPRFSILVPTRQRPDTLPWALATLIEQPGDDYEIVVADNCGDADVAKIVADAQKVMPRLRHIRSDQILPMAENWERGLAACTGEFVTVLGDDDGLMPDTLAVVRKLLASADTKLIDWNCHTYWWPDTIVTWQRNQLYVSLMSKPPEWRASKAIAATFFRGEGSFGNLPMIYQAFVHRDIIDKTRDKFGRYFMPPEVPPDVASGIINLFYTERYVHSHCALGIRGNSKRSNGTAHWTRAFGKDQRDTYLKDEGKTLEQIFHPSLVSSPNIDFSIANVKLRLKDVFFPDDDNMRVDLSLLVRSTIAKLNSEPESYDDNLADARRLADKIGYSIDPRSIPPKQSPPKRERARGLMGSPAAPMVAVNCDEAKIYNVAAAARLAEAISPAPSFEVAPGPADGPTLARNALCHCGSGKRFKHCHGRYA